MLHKNIKVAKLELIEHYDCVAGLEQTAANNEPTILVSADMQELLWTMVEIGGNRWRNT